MRFTARKLVELATNAAEAAFASARERKETLWDDDPDAVREGGLRIYVDRRGRWCVTTPARVHRNAEARNAIMSARLNKTSTVSAEKLAIVLVSSAAIRRVQIADRDEGGLATRARSNQHSKRNTVSVPLAQNR